MHVRGRFETRVVRRYRDLEVDNAPISATTADLIVATGLFGAIPYFVVYSKTMCCLFSTLTAFNY
jgi:hypothetical protein